MCGGMERRRSELQVLCQVECNVQFLGGVYYGILLRKRVRRHLQGYGLECFILGFRQRVTASAYGKKCAKENMENG